MSKEIETLVEDIYGLFGSSNELDKYIADEFAKQLSDTLVSRVTEAKGNNTLRMSNVGSKCLRKLWYTLNEKDQEPIPLRKEVRFKFLYGDIIESVVLFLAAEAGHKVEGQQDKLELNGVVGHRDAVIDGVLVDVKSAATYSFQKFKEHLTPENDAFGYIPQLMLYLEASQNDPLVTDKDRAAFLAVDKQLGHICLDIHVKDHTDWSKYIDDTRDVLNRIEPPNRSFEPEPEGKSGNMKLGTNCSYCEWHKVCWPNVQTYLYSTGPKHLVEVVREPNVPKA